MKVAFELSRRLAHQLGVLTIGRYTIEPIPSDNPAESTGTYLLRFGDEGVAGQSQPSTEAELFLSFLSLSLCSRLYIGATMIGNSNVGQLSNRNVYGTPFDGVVDDMQSVKALWARFLSLEIDLARQVIRSCEVYRTAVNMIGQNNTFAFFLLTIAVECLSNKVMSGQGTCDRFVAFVLKYCLEKGNVPDDEQLAMLLKEVYYNHRSGFTHGGKQIPQAVFLADQLQRSYVRHNTDGKERCTPGLLWFASVARNSIVGFLNSQEITWGTVNDHFRNLAAEQGVIALKVKTGFSADEKKVPFDRFQLD